MAYINTTRGMNATFSDRFALVVNSVKESMRRRKMYKQTLNELAGLSDRELADLGMHRSMIAGIALEAAYGK